MQPNLIRFFSVTSRLKKYATKEQKSTLYKRVKNKKLNTPYDSLNHFNTDYTKKHKSEEELALMAIKSFKPV